MTNRIGPTEPDNRMVICPHCTSQFQAISVMDQKDLEKFGRYFDCYSTLRLDGDKTAAFMADTYNDWDPDTDWGDYLDEEMEKFL